MSTILDITPANFELAVIEASKVKPVLLDFWAPWCGPCKTIAPILEEVAKEFEDKLFVAKLNVDDHNEIAQKFSVRGIPTLILFKGGVVHAARVGASAKGQLVAFLNANLS